MKRGCHPRGRVPSRHLIGHFDVLWGRPKAPHHRKGPRPEAELRSDVGRNESRERRRRPRKSVVERALSECCFRSRTSFAPAVHEVRTMSANVFLVMVSIERTTYSSGIRILSSAAFPLLHRLHVDRGQYPTSAIVGRCLIGQRVRHDLTFFDKRLQQVARQLPRYPIESAFFSASVGLRRRGRSRHRGRSIDLIEIAVMDAFLQAFPTECPRSGRFLRSW